MRPSKPKPDGKQPQAECSDAGPSAISRLVRERDRVGLLSGRCLFPLVKAVDRTIEEVRVRIRLGPGAKEIRTAGPILVFIDRGGRFETKSDGTALVDIGAFAGDPPHDPRGQYRRHPYRLETLSAARLK